MSEPEHTPLRPMDLQLTVNYTPLDLGMPIRKREPLAPGFKELNWFSKTMMLAAPWAPILFSRAPALSCFIALDEVGKDPVRDFFAIAEGRMSFFVYLTCWGGVLRIFQANLMAKEKGRNVYAHLFAEQAQARLGLPTIENSRMRLWREGDRELISAKERFYLRWAYGAWRTRK
jgi:hypothetical protein